MAPVVLDICSHCSRKQTACQVYMQLREHQPQCSQHSHSVFQASDISQGYVRVLPQNCHRKFSQQFWNDKHSLQRERTNTIVVAITEPKKSSPKLTSSVILYRQLLPTDSCISVLWNEST